MLPCHFCYFLSQQVEWCLLFVEKIKEAPKKILLTETQRTLVCFFLLSPFGYWKNSAFTGILKAMLVV